MITLGLLSFGVLAPFYVTFRNQNPKKTHKQSTLNKEEPQEQSTLDRDEK